ncbi:MAG: prolipoprotein diacylglyceryl transferase [Armatimonadetes bacterium]|nr:prolipoprotein diacylglyceryl transferase [Armatimonadota bacterium]
MYPTIFQIGSFKLASFGLMMVVAFLASLMLARKRAPKFGISADSLSDIAFWAILAGILGARVFFIIQEIPYYSKHLGELLSIQFQGLTSFGGFIVGGLVAAYVCKKKGVPILACMDLFAPAFILGHAIGRIGCLLNGCCHGAPAKSAFPFLAYSSEVNAYCVPAQLYDSAMNVGVLFLLLSLEKRSHRRAGYTLGMALILHGLTRFIYEFFRAGTSSTTIGLGNLPITDGHVMAVVIMVVGGFFVLRSKPVEVPVAQ